MAHHTFVKPLWNVRIDGEPEKTALATESAERRYATGRGYCVTADSAAEAKKIMWKYRSQQKRGDTPSYDLVQQIIHRGVPVLMDAPRW